MGFAVRKARSSVQRNRVRRLLRESFRQRQTVLRAICAERRIALRCVFLLNAQKAAAHLRFAEVDEAVRTILTAVEEKLQAS